MKIILIIFTIIFIIVKLWTNYISNNLEANIKYNLNGGNAILGLLIISEYILGAIIIIKIILNFMD